MDEELLPPPPPKKKVAPAQSGGEGLLPPPPKKKIADTTSTESATSLEPSATPLPVSSDSKLPSGSGEPVRNKVGTVTDEEKSAIEEFLNKPAPVVTGGKKINLTTPPDPAKNLLTQKPKELFAEENKIAVEKRNELNQKIKTDLTGNFKNFVLKDNLSTEQYFSGLEKAGYNPIDVQDAKKTFLESEGINLNPEPKINKFYSTLNTFNQRLTDAAMAIPEAIAIGAYQIDNKLLGVDKNLEEYATYQLAKATKKLAKEFWPTNPEFESDLTTKLASGGADIVSFMAGGALAKGLKISATATMAGMGAVQNAVPEFETARNITTDVNNLSFEQFVQKYAKSEQDYPTLLAQYNQLKGKDPDQVGWDMFIKAGLVGTTEAIPINLALSRFDKITGGKMRNVILNSVKGGTEEAFQEIVSQYLNNIAATSVYDEQRNIYTGMVDAGVPAFILGSLLNGIGSSIAAKIQEPGLTKEQLAELQLAQKENTELIESLPEDKGEVVKKPITNEKISALEKQKESIENQIAGNENISPQARTLLITQVEKIDEQIENEKATETENRITQGKNDAAVARLNEEKAKLEEDIKNVPDEAKNVIQQEINAIETQIKELTEPKTPVDDIGGQSKDVNAKNDAELLSEDINKKKKQLLELEEDMTLDPNIKAAKMAPIENDIKELSTKLQAIYDPKLKAELEAKAAKEAEKNAKAETPPAKKVETEKTKEEAQEGFDQAGKKSKEENSGKPLAEYLLQNSKVGDTITDKNGEGYEVTEVRTTRKGTKELMLIPFTIVDGKKIYNYQGVRLISETLKKGAEDLYELHYSNYEGERIIERYTYNKKTEETKPDETKKTQKAEVLKQEPEDVLPEERKFSSEGEYNRYVSTESNDPHEIIQSYQSTRDLNKTDVKESILAEGLGKIKESGYIRFGDKNNLVDKNNKKTGKARVYFSEKGLHIDQAAQELSSQYGIEITPNDIIEFIDKYPNGKKDFYKQENELAGKLKERYKKVTGKNLTEKEILRRKAELGKQLDPGGVSQNILQEINSVLETPFTDITDFESDLAKAKDKKAFFKPLNNLTSKRLKELQALVNEIKNGKTIIHFDEATGKYSAVGLPYRGSDKAGGQKAEEPPSSYTPSNSTQREVVKAPAPKKLSGKKLSELSDQELKDLGFSSIHEALNSTKKRVEGANDPALFSGDESTAVTAETMPVEYVEAASKHRQEEAKVIAEEERAKVIEGLDQKIKELEKSVFGTATKEPSDFKPKEGANQNRVLPGVVESGKLQDKFFADRMSKFGEGLAREVEKLSVSNNQIARAVADVIRAIFPTTAITKGQIIRSEDFHGDINRATGDPGKINELLKEIIGNDKISLSKIDRVIDPDFYKQLTKEEFIEKVKAEMDENSPLLDLYDEYNEKFKSQPPITYEDLTPAEKIVHDLVKKINDLVHDVSFATGGITHETYLKNKDKYAGRLYDIFELPSDMQKSINEQYSKATDKIFKQRTEVDDWKKLHKIEDPVYAAATRLRQVMINKAVFDYAEHVVKTKPEFVSDVEKPGFTKLADKGYGKLSGKYVTQNIAEDFKGFFYQNETLNKLYDILKKYDTWGPRRFYKKLFTVYNPGVHVGNIMGDNMFAFLQGIDFISLNYNLGFAKREINGYGATYRYLIKKGLLKSDLTRGDLVKSLEVLSNMQEEAAASTTPFKTFLKNIKKNVNKGAGKAESVYGGVDDLYKISAFKCLVDGGYTAEQAVELVAEGFQNYKRVGKLYDFTSKIPVVGQPFGKFSGDLARILKNAGAKRPLNLIAFGATLHAIAALASHSSGESEEERKLRENRPGAAKIPLPDILGGNISLDWLLGNKVLNVARFVSPVYIYGNLDENNDKLELIKKLLPISFETVDRTNNPTGPTAVTIAKNINDPLFTWLQLLPKIDSDFKGRPTIDPTATKYKPSKISDNERVFNVLRFFGRQYIPYGALGDDLIYAALGKEGYYSKKTVTEVFARFVGVKLEAFPEERYKEISTNKIKSLHYQFKDDLGEKMQNIPMDKPIDKDERIKINKIETIKSKFINNATKISRVRALLEKKKITFQQSNNIIAPILEEQAKLLADLKDL